jgi:hypothetical protein
MSVWELALASFVECLTKGVELWPLNAAIREVSYDDEMN